MNTADVARWREAEMLLAADLRLGPLLQRVGPCRLEPVWPSSVFAALFKAIVYQQLNGRAALTIFERVRQTFPDPARLSPEGLARVSDETLRAAGLSRGKLAAARDLAAHVLAGHLPTLDEATGLSDEQVIERLTIVRGIGPWTAQMFLIFNLGRPDVWPASDFGVRTAVATLWRKRALPDERFMQRVARTWQPWRSVASWYLWRSIDPAPQMPVEQ